MVCKLEIKPKSNNSLRIWYVLRLLKAILNMVSVAVKQGLVQFTAGFSLQAFKYHYPEQKIDLKSILRYQ